MRKIISTLTLVLFCLTAFGQDRDTVYISHKYTTSFYFPTDVIYVRLSSEDDVVAALAKETKAVVYARAREAFSGSCSLTCIEANGKAHTYILLYRESPKTLLIDEKNQNYTTVPDTIEVSSSLMTLVIYASEIVEADISRRRLIVGTPVKESPNIFSVLAREPHNELSSLSILDASGSFHTYVLKNNENPDKLIIDERESGTWDPNNTQSVTWLRSEDAPSLKDVYNIPQSIYHIATRHGRIEFVCENVFTYSDIMFITLRLDNNSGVSYETDGANFVVKRRKTLKRQDENRMQLIPTSKYGALTSAPGQSSRITFSFNKLTLNKNQALYITLYEKGYEDIGGREFTLKLSADDINLAKRPVKSK